MGILKLTPSTFSAATTNGTVLVDFFASWCGPCKMLSPILSDLAAEYDGTLTVGKLDIDEGADLANRYGVVAVPTLMLFRDGVPISKIVGYREKDELDGWIRENL